MRKLTAIGAAAVAVLALGACSKTDDGKTAGQKVDQVIAQSERKGDDVKAEGSRDMEQAKQSAEKGMDRATDAVADASITASIKTDLAKDPSLSALKIDVDTSNGHVKLNGTAPTDAARDRATQIAMAVKGVQNVDNLLTVEPVKQ